MPTIPAQLGPYTIDREIGRGGMGVVYLGRDTKLDRAVAIKALPEHLAADPDRLARFEREARTLASLTHANVAGIYGVEEADGAKYLVLEFVEGETLAERLDRGPLEVDEALDVCAQIAAGVEAAHEAGVIHRDLKPANVKITPDGKVKVLDFGLAKAEEGASTTGSGMGQSESPTLTSPAIQHSPTIPGAILGTAGYMSPEQARGRKLDKRTDIWSFGVVLYECLTGASPFIGETVSDSIGAILHKDVDLDRLPSDTPRMVRHVLVRCLERDKSKRLRDIGDARIEIELALNDPELEVDSGSQAKRGVHPAIVFLSAFVFTMIGAGAVVFFRTSPPIATIRATIEPPNDSILIYTGDLAGPAAISRDGKRIAFSAKQSGEEQRLYIRNLDASNAESTRGTQGATFPFWSWDGESVGYFAQGELRRYDLATRTNRRICAAPAGRGGTWLGDGTIAFTPGFQSPIHRVDAEGGEPTPFTTIDETRHTSHRWPSVTPDGESVVYIAISHNPGMVDESALFLSTPGRSTDIEITRAQYGASVIDDQLLVVREGALYATPFRLSSGTLVGPQTMLVDHVASDLSTWNASFSASQSGALVFHETVGDALEDRVVFGGSTIGEAVRTLLVQRDGRPTNILADGVAQSTTALSPGYEYLAISAAPEGGTSGRAGFDIWLYRLPLEVNLAAEDEEARHSGQSSALTQSRLEEPPRRLTFLDGAEVYPRWSPDGQWIVFGRLFTEGSSTPAGLYKVRVSGGRPELLLETPDSDLSALLPTQWTPDGKYILYAKGAWVGIGINDLFALDLETNEVIPLVENTGDDDEGRVSPDGKWLSYHSNESGQLEVFVIPFAPAWSDARARGEPAPSENARWRISIAGGSLGRWNPAGGELFYISNSNSMIAVNVETDGIEFLHDVGSALFEASNESGLDFEVSSNGQRFAINSSGDERETSISIITNWKRLLERRVAP